MKILISIMKLYTMCLSTKGELQIMEKIMKKNKKFVFLVSLTAIVTTLTSLIAPIIIQYLTNKKNLNSQAMIYIFLAMLLSLVIQLVIMVYKENFAARFNSNYLFTLINKMIHLKYDSYITLEPTYLINRIFSAVDALYLFLISSFSVTIKSIFTILLSLLMVSYLSIEIVLFMILLIPLNYFGFKYINKKLKVRMENMQKNAAVANKNLISTLSNQDAVKAGISAEILENLLYEKINLMYQSVASTNKFAQSTSSIVSFINQSFQTFVYIRTSMLIAADNLPISSLIILSILLPLFFSSLSELSKVTIDLNTLTTANTFIKDSLDKNIERDGDIDIDAIASIQLFFPTFEIDGNQFQYRIQENLQNGDRVYLTGKSGSGKSSLLKLLLKFRESSGIMINDLPINAINNKSLRNKIAYLAQEPTILTETLEKNIGMGTPLSYEQKQLILNTGILNPILKTKDWETVLTENGSNLSGGEKQRIAVARLILADADVYILDESTSNIDEESSQAIFETLLECVKDKIFIFTSHDKKNSQYANKIINI
ncbi:hypothetical protein UCO_00801 [Enterococcus faecalis EnGen0244]|nr:hypothetical protein UCO_00801 [Enterococcus faecalis EnGen0244]EOI93607.1 hypothetical protein UM9_01080 [Enterococcus faecalis EnGen0298]EOJ94200.1 hypothetical protein WOG_00688 [Enterococcus faecalis EnGen0370]EOL59521.1 hypothetical protein UCQ_00676 [Enterococcus faecalis EnGen0245]RBR51153.1 hypothetical protein EB30_01665 [Enterococcus faecalis]